MRRYVVTRQVATPTSSGLSWSYSVGYLASAGAPSFVHWYWYWSVTRSEAHRFSIDVDAIAMALEHDGSVEEVEQ